MDKKNPKLQKGKQNEQYPTNHRIRPDEMTIFEAAEIGMEHLKKNAQYNEFVEGIKKYGK